METPEINSLKRKLKFSYVAIAILVIVSIGFFFYGRINNIQAMKDKEAELISRVQLKECESISTEMTRKALLAEGAARLSQHEAEHQRTLAEEALAKAKKSK